MQRDSGQQTFDDGGGLRVVSARFEDEQRFAWDLFSGYDTLRVLTYSASVPAIVRMLDDYDFAEFDCVFGCEKTLHQLKDILAFQKVAIGDTRAAIMGLKDRRHIEILKKINAGAARFRVLRKSIAHAKLYLLSNSADGETRVIIGSANLSEQAFSGNQPETLVKFDNDSVAWEHYNKMFNEISANAADEIPLPQERILQAEIEVTDAPIVSSDSTTLIIDPAIAQYATFSGQIEKIEKVAAVIAPKIDPIAAANTRGGRLTLSPQIKREISRIQLVKSAEEADNRYFSINRESGMALLSGEPFPLDWDADAAATDARLLIQYFANYEGTFQGDVERLQRDYFALTAWLYFSPFMCDLRGYAATLDADMVRYPLFAIVFGKSNCGKTALVDTLMISMFGHSNTVHKSYFTASRLRAIQSAYKRFPAVFDDIDKRPFANHGVNMIKNELLPEGLPEYSGFILSMNQDIPSFPDEVVKRALMIYTQTALPSYDEPLRQRLSDSIVELRRNFTGHLYRCYLTEIMDRLSHENLPSDWMALSTDVLNGIIAESVDGAPPRWCAPVGWTDYTARRYDRIKSALDSLLGARFYVKDENQSSGNRWTLDGDKIIVIETPDIFGRKQFQWEDVPSTLIDQDAGIGGRTALYRDRVEEFVGRKITPPGGRVVAEADGVIRARNHPAQRGEMKLAGNFDKALTATSVFRIPPANAKSNRHPAAQHLPAHTP